MVGESRLVFSGTLPVECHKMLLGADFPFASSLVCLQGFRTEHRANKCVWKSDVSSWFFLLLFFNLQKLECKAPITGKHCHALA